MEVKVKHLALKAVPRWDQLRSLGELRVLSQASYISLVTVPVLASVWPAVRNVLRDLGAEFTDLPLTLAVAFFGAVGAVIGQTIYQASAPANLRNFSRMEHTAFRIRDFQLNPTNENLQVFRRNVMRRFESFDHGFRRILEARIARAEAAFTEGNSQLSSDQMTDAVRAYAEVHYDIGARTAPLPRATCALAYSVTLMSIIFIFCRQCYIVAQEAGLLNMAS